MSAQCLIATSQTWPSTAALPALFEQAGAEVVSFSPGSLGLSGFVAERIRCSREPRSAAAQLRKLLKLRSFDFVVIADELLLAALVESDGFADATANWLPIDATDVRASELALSKYAFVERASEIGVRVPDSRFAESLTQAATRGLELGYPVVVKGDRGFAGSQVRICHDVTDLRSACRELFAHHARLLVQRHIPGQPVSVCVAYVRGKVAAYKAYRAEYCYPDAHSASTVHTYFEHPAILATAEALGEATGFHGLVGIDFMLDGESLYALEINPRPTIGFTGTAANRSFFEPSIRNLVAGTPIAKTIAYDGREKMQTYFPGHLFYMVSHLMTPGPSSWHRFFSCLREARARDAKLTAWEISRFMYDEAKRRVPVFLNAMTRGPVRSSLHVVANVDPVGTVR